MYWLKAPGIGYCGRIAMVVFVLTGLTSIQCLIDDSQICLLPLTPRDGPLDEGVPSVLLGEGALAEQGLVIHFITFPFSPSSIPG